VPVTSDSRDQIPAGAALTLRIVGGVPAKRHHLLPQLSLRRWADERNQVDEDALTQQAGGGR
jgi:hypothetical protein